MNSLHDMGGAHNYGPVVIEPEEPVFHHNWEKLSLVLTLALGTGGRWNIDKSRHARESLPPLTYLSSSYYEIWFEALLKLCLDAGLITPEEARDGQLRQPGDASFKVLQPESIDALFHAGWPSLRSVPEAPRFKPGDRVRARMMNPATHTRLPRYCRGKAGTIVHQHGAHVYPDTNAHGQGEQPCHLYTVRFDAHELWGPDTTASAVHVDCWERYLEAAQ